MALHREVAAGQENAAGALRNLAAGSEAQRLRLADAGAMEALLQAMALHREVAAGQVNVAGRLSAVARRRRSHGGAAPSHGPAVVASVQENAAGALRNLADGSEALKQRLADAGAMSPATLTATPTATPPATPTATPTAMLMATPTATPPATLAATPTATLLATLMATPEATPKAAWSITPTATPSATLTSSEALLLAMALHREVAAVQSLLPGRCGFWPPALGLRSSGSPTQEPGRRCSWPWPCIEK